MQAMTIFSKYAAKATPTTADKLLIDDVADATTASGMEKVITLGQVVSLVTGGGTILYPSGDTTGATDTPVVTAALAAATAGTVITLGAGSWYINSPMVIPAGVRLRGVLADVNDIAVYGTTINTPHATWAQGGAPFAAAVILNADSQCDTFNLNCHFANSNAMDGITSNNASNVLVHDINIYNGPNNGINALGNTWRGERVMVTQAVTSGFTAPASDSDWIDCNASASQAAGWICNNPINSRLIGCRAEFNTTRGYQITGDNTATGSFSMIGCSTDRNGTDGIYINNTGSSHILLSGTLQRRDGSTGGSTSALNIAATNTAPVIIGDHSIFPGFNDDGSGTDTPLTGITIGSGATYVAVANAMVHAITTPVSGAITQARSVATRTGAWNSPSAVLMLADTGGPLRTVTTSPALAATDSVVLLNAATLTATLPTAVGIAGRLYTVKLITASTGTVATTSSQTIDGSTTYSLSANHKYVTVVSDGANWQITANN